MTWARRRPTRCRTHGVYDHDGGAPTPVLDAAISGDANCADGTCWQSLAWGLKFRSSTGAPDGVTAAKLRPGLPEKSKFQVKAKGEHLATPALPLEADPLVTAQIRTSDGKCWGATFSTFGIRDNTPIRFRAKSD